MRADVKKLFSGIIEKLSLKLSILQDILERESDKRYLLKTDSVAALLSVIDDDNHHLETIDVLDFEISALQNRICEIAGIPSRSLKNHIRKSNADLSSEYFDLISQIDSVLTSLYGERERLIREMEDTIADIGSDIESLRRIMKLKRS